MEVGLRSGKKNVPQSNTKLWLLFLGVVATAGTIIVILGVELAALSQKVDSLDIQSTGLKTLVNGDNKYLYISSKLKKKNKTIYLIRHGETAMNVGSEPRVRGRLEVDLNEDGFRHADQAGQFLAKEKITKIYYSNVRRAKQTAEKVHKYHPEAAFIEEPLALDISWGDWEGHTYTEAFGDKTGGDYTQDPYRVSIPNGESFFKCIDRFRDLFYRILLDDNEDNVVIVSHGTNLNLVGCFIADAPYHKFYHWYMSAAGVSKIILNDIDDIRIEYWNACHFLK